MAWSRNKVALVWYEVVYCMAKRAEARCHLGDAYRQRWLPNFVIAEKNAWTLDIMQGDPAGSATSLSAG